MGQLVPLQCGRLTGDEEARAGRQQRRRGGALQVESS
jgi:hypothetical protein